MDRRKDRQRQFLNSFTPKVETQMEIHTRKTEQYIEEKQTEKQKDVE